jgi:hypothetical protein
MKNNEKIISILKKTFRIIMLKFKDTHLKN